MNYAQLPTAELLTRVRSIADTRDNDDSDELWNLIPELWLRPDRAVFEPRSQVVQWRRGFGKNAGGGHPRAAWRGN